MTENFRECNRGQPEQPGFYTVKETAGYLRLCEKQVRRLIERGELPAHRFGTALRIKKQAVDAYVEARRVPAASRSTGGQPQDPPESYR
jgi:excisionase family DNA binding protein